MRVADLEVDESALSAVASAVSAARYGIGFDPEVTRGTIDAVGVAGVAEAIDDTTRAFARRAELLADALERLRGFPAVFVREFAVTETMLVAGVRAGAAAAGGAATAAGAAGAGAGSASGAAGVGGEGR
ncbi:hypothetical protein FFA01_27050 [Frigoribacterium faeni]|uniref:Uncharacterized protein n=1 Tax=Frigoribacterium faeni TaxID=145483 RepID=A0ABQ0USE1_9MICO|nr:hypothetical protein GCM10025699_56670 [Microbacterium flavescens]GEK84396.1 hypothetical protein FFA01_27050 [Frigoribacterium faeni]